MAELHVLIFLFFVALISATVIPAQAELVLFALLATGEYDEWLLVGAACAGNVLGTSVNWWIGRYINRFQKARWFPVKKKYLKKAERLFQKHGKITLLLAGIPFIGDPITIVAGMLKVNFWFFLPVAGFAKCLRYIFVWAIYQGIF